MDDLLTLLAVAGINYVMGVPGADDVMLNPAPPIMTYLPFGVCKICARA
jgi:hypothetical protein